MPTPEFIEVANAMLDEIFSEMLPPELYVASRISYWAEDKPRPSDFYITNTDPSADILLGMFTPEPSPKIRIFEQSILRTQSMWEDMIVAVKAVLAHEIWQHGLGLDHTRETIADGFTPAFSLPHDIRWCGCHAFD